MSSIDSDVYHYIIIRKSLDSVFNIATMGSKTYIPKFSLKTREFSSISLSSFGRKHYVRTTYVRNICKYIEFAMVRKSYQV
jgi:hypothetical protein